MTDTMDDFEGEFHGRDAQAVIDVATAAAEPQELEAGKRYSVVVPHGGRLAEIDTEAQLDRPRRRTGVTTHFTGESLAGYISDYREPGTTLWADIERSSMVAVLNDHVRLTDLGGWADHRAVFTARKTVEWQRWTAADNKLGDQVAFAEHIELGLAEIRDPNAATMLELAQHFEAKKDVNFRSANILDNGQRQLVYEETIQATAGRKGDITIPKEFKLGLIPFEGCEPYPVTARLRYRIREGHLQIGYILDHPEEVLRRAFDDVVLNVESLVELQAFRGTRP